MKNKTSLCITVKNKDERVEEVLKAVKKQTRKPDEIIVIDGEETGTTIAQGRNLAVKRAKNEIIVMIDAGCIPHPDWLAKITKPFESGSQVVAGFYRMTGRSYLQKAFMPYLGVVPEKYNSKTFLPSCRSIAFTRSAWKKVGGFRENLSRAGEDTAFAYDLLQKKISILRVKEAVVDWEVPKTWGKFFQKIIVYVRGDWQTQIWHYFGITKMSHNLKILSVFLRYLVFIAVFIFISRPLSYLLFVTYLLWSIYKHRILAMPIQSRALLPLVQIASDMAVVSGTLKEFVSAFLNSPNHG